MDNTKELPTLLSLCSGYGGIERGLELAGFKHRVIAHVEIEAFAIAHLVEKMEKGRLHPAPIWSNLKTLPLDCFRGRVDVLTGGYPCQPFSAAGQRKGKDDPRHLWPYIFEIIKAIKPFRCFFENVEGHISLGLREVISDLESLGYQTTWGIFSAREVGAPHQRKRVFIMADTQSQRHGSGGGQRDLHKADGGQVGKCLSITAITSKGATRELADTDDSGGGASKCKANKYESTVVKGWEEQPQFKPSRQCEDLADTNGTRSQAGLSRQERPDEERHAREPDHGGGEQGRWQIEMPWPPEPSVGRVVDGVADRVDRIRLLGNGVVPQTAALAWVTLEKQLEKAGRGNEPGRLE